MTNILVDPDKLRWGATEIERVAGEADAAVRELNIPTLVEDINPEYAVQLAAKVRSYGAQLVGQTAPIVNGLREHSTWLRELARRFEEADLASAQGMERLWASTQALIAKYGESPFVPLWILDGTRPPWIDANIWRQMDPDDRLAMMAYLRREWANFMAGRTEGSFRSPTYSSAYYEVMFQIFLFGLPASLFQEREDGTLEQVEPYYDLGHELFDKPELPDGSVVYLDANGRPRFKKYQYQDLPEYYETLEKKELLEQLGLTDGLADLEAGRWSRSHYNLCGLDSTGHAVGAQNMFQIYVAYGATDELMLKTGGTMWTYEVRDLYRDLGWEADQIGRFADTEHAHWLNWDEEDRLAQPTFSQVEEKLRDGYVITPLVGVNSGTGHLSSDPSSVGHFVNFLETMTTRDGTELVRVYNPMFHREEIYTWHDFDRIWQHAGGNSGGQGVIARPPGAGG